MLFIFAMARKKRRHGEELESGCIGGDNLERGEPWEGKEERSWLSGHMGRVSLLGRGSAFLALPCLRHQQTSTSLPPEEVGVFC